MSAQPIAISIIIVTWNGRQFTLECLDSLRFYLDDRKVEIIVVDNASSDGTPELVDQDFPWVRLIRNSSNLGFAKANNIGIVASKGRYVCLVNSDVKVPQDCLRAMEAYMEANPAVGLIGPRMLCPGELIGRSYMRFPTVWRALCNALELHCVFRDSARLSGIMMPDFDNRQTAEVDVLNGWFLMARRRAVEEVGMLDEQFFMYGEDIDWSLRFHKAGWKRVYFAGASAFHYGGASSSVEPARFYIEMKRANLLLYRKHHGVLQSVAYFTITGLHEVLRVAGNSLLKVVSTSGRSEAASKVKRSLACIQWLVCSGWKAKGRMA
jgi:GT2 family glycosyltransferase